MAQLLLLPVTWYVLTSHRWFWGVCSSRRGAVRCDGGFRRQHLPLMAEAYGAPDADEE